MLKKLAFIPAVAVAATVMFASPASAGAAVLTARLTGAAEVPGPGDTDGSGRATVVVDTSDNFVCVILRVSRIATPTAAHIHLGASTVAGPVALALTTPTRGRSFGCSAVDPELARNLAANPAIYYVNVHNAEFAAGAVRGQLAAV